jgi:hypothetical protein
VLPIAIEDSAFDRRKHPRHPNADTLNEESKKSTRGVGLDTSVNVAFPVPLNRNVRAADGCVLIRYKIDGPMGRVGRLEERIRRTLDQQVTIIFVVTERGQSVDDSDLVLMYVSINRVGDQLKIKYVSKTPRKLKISGRRMPADNTGSSTKRNPNKYLTCGIPARKRDSSKACARQLGPNQNLISQSEKRGSERRPRFFNENLIALPNVPDTQKNLIHSGSRGHFPLPRPVRGNAQAPESASSTCEPFIIAVFALDERQHVLLREGKLTLESI